MKIGIFDSGLGGLIIAKSIFKALPKYDYIYLGDTKHLPYGEKSPELIYKYTKRAVEFLFKQNCQLVIIACNTASALALRKLQTQYLPSHYPGRRILGMAIPTLEEADKLHKGRRIGVIATTATIKSHIYKRELTKIDKKAKIFELAAPDLVTLIEQNSLQKAKNRLKLYLEALEKKHIQTLILGCTHYPLLKSTAAKILGKKVSVLGQDDIIPRKLANYLKSHKEIRATLSKNEKRTFCITKFKPNFKQVAKRLFGKNIKLQFVKL